VLVADLMKERPTEVVDFMINWLQISGREIEKEGQLKCLAKARPEGVESSDEEESGDEVEALPMPVPKPKQNRTSVSAEVYGDFNKKGSYKPRVVSKSDECRSRLNTRLDEAFMFSC